MVGAAPFSRLVVVVLPCCSALASCFTGEGLAAAPVFASEGDGSGFFAATVVCAGFAGTAVDFGFAGSAGGGLRAAPPLFSLLAPNNVLGEPPAPPPPR